MSGAFWKNGAERIVVAALAAAAIAPVVFGSGLSFSGDIGAFSPWLLLPVALAIRLGTGMYACDGDQDSGDFLFSRPVGWRAIAAAKVALGIAVVLAACVLAALAYILFAAPQYARTSPTNAWRPGRRSWPSGRWPRLRGGMHHRRSRPAKAAALWCLPAFGR